MRFTDCTGCPLLNKDYENGSDCNMGYEQDYIMVNKEENEYRHISPNCELLEIKHTSGVIHPTRYVGALYGIKQEWIDLANRNEIIFSEKINAKS